MTESSPEESFNELIMTTSLRALAPPRAAQPPSGNSALFNQEGSYQYNVHMRSSLSLGAGIMCECDFVSGCYFSRITQKLQNGITTKPGGRTNDHLLLNYCLRIYVLSLICLVLNIYYDSTHRPYSSTTQPNRCTCAKTSF